jgi:hypothetical protein
MIWQWMKPDKRIGRAIRPADIRDLFERNLPALMERGMGAEAFFLAEGKAYEYTDFIFLEEAATVMYRAYKDYILIADRLMGVLSKYNPKMLSRPVALINQEDGRQDVYWFCRVEPAIRTEDVEGGVWAPKATGLCPSGGLVRLERRLSCRYAATLEATESILRRDAVGVRFEAMKEEEQP